MDDFGYEESLERLRKKQPPIRRIRITVPVPKVSSLNLCYLASLMCFSTLGFLILSPFMLGLAPDFVSMAMVAVHMAMIKLLRRAHEELAWFHELSNNLGERLLASIEEFDDPRLTTHNQDYSNVTNTD